MIFSPHNFGQSLPFPEFLQNALAELVAPVKNTTLLQAAQNLSKRYRGVNARRGSFIQSHEERIAYLLTRFPATYAVLMRVFLELQKRVSHERFTTLLDLGSGPGTAAWAALACFSPLEKDLWKKISLVEKDLGWVEIGRSLMRHLPSFLGSVIAWEAVDIEKGALPTFTYDLVTLSYALGEIEQAKQEALLEKAWNATGKFLILIEPGTPAGFERIRFGREKLLALGGNLIAPCPHAKECPLKGGDWCHFAERVPRSSLHRFLKEGDLGYEDEKFSYLIVGRAPCALPTSRILRHPRKNSGHVLLTLCTEEGVKKQVVSRKEKELYQKARKREWGQEWGVFD